MIHGTNKAIKDTKMFGVLLVLLLASGSLKQVTFVELCSGLIFGCLVMLRMDVVVIEMLFVVILPIVPWPVEVGIESKAIIFLVFIKAVVPRIMFVEDFNTVDVLKAGKYAIDDESGVFVSAVALVLLDSVLSFLIFL